MVVVMVRMVFVRAGGERDCEGLAVVVRGVGVVFVVGSGGKNG